MSVPRRALLYDRVYETLKNQIVSGYFQKGEMIPTERELIEQFGVSRATTNKALTRLMHEGWIIRKAGAGTFVSYTQSDENQTAKASVERASGGIVGFVIPFIGEEYGLALLAETERQLQQRGANLALGMSYGDQEQERAVIDRLQSLDVDGLIIFPTDGAYYNESILRLYVERLPMVIVDKPMPGVPLPLVMSDHTLGASMLTQHLLQLGHKHIAFISPPYENSSPHQERLIGYQRALEEANVPFNPNDCIEVDWTRSVKDNEFDPIRITAIRQFLETHPEVTAVFCSQYTLAEHAYAAAMDLGRTVPDHLSIGCFDSPRVRPMHWQVTHIAQDQEAIAAEAVRIIFQRLNNEDVAAQRILIPPTLRVGSSTRQPNEEVR